MRQRAFPPVVTARLRRLLTLSTRLLGRYTRNVISTTRVHTASLIRRGQPIKVIFIIPYKIIPNITITNSNLLFYQRIRYMLRDSFLLANADLSRPLGHRDANLCKNYGSTVDGTSHNTDCDW